MTALEAVALADTAEARSALLVHYDPDRLPELDSICTAAGRFVRPAIDGQTVTVTPATGAGGPGLAAAWEAAPA
jgi:hypothetical protein